ncbi:hypothetical protein [Sphingomonas sp. NIC1]|uniref:hypothetical protein n=1 Tax=Sphingomonas sp. NIC1 TaxID=1961362 RepID=UPI0007C0E75F|nr:hypothetical protein [Sphingomonas sp. NIC1]ANC85438.1 hypothetical protein A7E77_00120 [Sphingomonas sp. NIC1]
MKHDAIRAADAAKLSIPDIVQTILGLAAELPTARRVEIMRALNADLTWSYGADRIDQGLDLIEDDLRCEEQQAHSLWSMPELRTVGVMPVSLNSDAWRA